MSQAGGSDWVRSGIGGSTADSISVRGHDLTDLMGTVSFPDLAWLMVTGGLPGADESRLFNAVLVSLADHGLTPSVLAARLTSTGAPEALQAAVAAGLLGAGSVYLGPTEDTARLLHAVVEAASLDAGSDPDAVRDAAEAAVRAELGAGRRVPGLGHPVHKTTDPRVPRLYALAAECDRLGPHLRLLDAFADAYEWQQGRRLPVNGAGAAGAVLADLGLPVEMARGFAVLARTAGLVAHLAEEREWPLGPSLYAELERRNAGPPPG
jgi:citrate synthase